MRCTGYVSYGIFRVFYKSAKVDYVSYGFVRVMIEICQVFWVWWLR